MMIKHHSFKSWSKDSSNSNPKPYDSKKGVDSGNLAHRGLNNVCCSIEARIQPSYAWTYKKFIGVPPHFFSEEGLKHVADATEHPLYLHPSTSKITNLEVAKFFTIIDLIKPLLEAIIMQFESWEIPRVQVSCPWLRPICDHCHEIKYSIICFITTPITCSGC